MGCIIPVNNKTDRRQDSEPVTFERRSGTDRRSDDRLSLPPALQQDIVSIKGNAKDVFAAFKTLDNKTQYNNSPVKVINQYTQNANTDDNKKVQFEKAMVEGMASSVPFVRRGIGCRDAFDNNDDIKGWGKVAILVLNVLEDGRDMTNAGKQILHIPLKEGQVKIPNTHQTKFNFFRGSIIEPLFCKLPPEIRSKIAYYDVSLYDTKLGKKFLNKIGKPKETVTLTSRPDKLRGGFVRSYMLEGKKLSCITGRAMMRIPVVTIYAFSALEIPAIIKGFTSADNLKDDVINGGKQLVKSGINVGSFITTSAVAGALLAGKFGATGSLVGLGIGSYYGSKLGNYINAQIDKI